MLRLSEKDYQRISSNGSNLPKHCKEKSSFIRKLRLLRGVYAGKDNPFEEVIKMEL